MTNDAFHRCLISVAFGLGPTATVKPDSRVLCPHPKGSTMRTTSMLTRSRRTVGLSFATLMLLSVLVAVPMSVSATVAISISGGVSTKEVNAGNSVTYTLRIDNNSASLVNI